VVYLNSANPCYICQSKVILLFDKDGIKAECMNCGFERVEWEVTNGIEQLKVVAYIHKVELEDIYRKIDEANSRDLL